MLAKLSLWNGRVEEARTQAMVNKGNNACWRKTVEQAKEFNRSRIRSHSVGSLAHGGCTPWPSMPR